MTKTFSDKTYFNFIGSMETWIKENNLKRFFVETSVGKQQDSSLYKIEEQDGFVIMSKLPNAISVLLGGEAKITYHPNIKDALTDIYEFLQTMRLYGAEITLTLKEEA